VSAGIPSRRDQSRGEGRGAKLKRRPRTRNFRQRIAKGGRELRHLSRKWERSGSWAFPKIRKRKGGTGRKEKKKKARINKTRININQVVLRAPKRKEGRNEDIDGPQKKLNGTIRILLCQRTGASGQALSFTFQIAVVGDKPSRRERRAGGVESKKRNLQNRNQNNNLQVKTKKPATHTDPAGLQ